MPINVDPLDGGAGALIVGDFKLVVVGADDADVGWLGCDMVLEDAPQWQSASNTTLLFNLADDPNERSDLAADPAHAHTLAQLLARYAAWTAEVRRGATQVARMRTSGGGSARGTKDWRRLSVSHHVVCHAPPR